MIKYYEKTEDTLSFSSSCCFFFCLNTSTLKFAQATEAKVSKNILSPPSGEICLVIDTFRRKLIVMNDYKPYAQFPVAIGKANTPSPIGNWKIINKGVNWGTGFGTRWLGLNVPWGIYGIHGTNKPSSIGSMASHGCFRMFNKDVETIFPWIKNGTPVIVIGNPFGYMSGGLQKLNVGDKCSAVTVIQEKLWRRGFYEGKADGIYGRGTEKAVKELQKRHSLEKTGQVGYQEYDNLGIVN
ncbi:MAG: L,D-transpeptidase family protein [Peptococcia bacterium]